MGGREGMRSVSCDLLQTARAGRSAGRPSSGAKYTLIIAAKSSSKHGYGTACGRLSELMLAALRRTRGVSCRPAFSITKSPPPSSFISSCCGCWQREGATCGAVPGPWLPPPPVRGSCLLLQRAGGAYTVAAPSRSAVAGGAWPTCGARPCPLLPPRGRPPHPSW